MVKVGETNAEKTVRLAVRNILEGEPLIDGIDYVSVADATTLEELERVDGPAMVSTAVRMGRTRLIDNVVVGWLTESGRYQIPELYRR